MRCVWLSLLLLACNRGHDTPAIPEPLAILPGTGIVAIEMNGDWRVAEVQVQQEDPDARGTLPNPAGFAPPVLDAELHVAGDQALEAGGRELRLVAYDPGTVSDWINHVDGRRLIFSHFVATPAQRGVADSGSSGLLQFSFGSVDEDTMSGLVQHRIEGFTAHNRPLFGLYRVTLRRIVPPPPAPAMPTSR